jgi:hypothetical protein
MIFCFTVDNKVDYAPLGLEFMRVHSRRALPCAIDYKAFSLWNGDIDYKASSLLAYLFCGCRDVNFRG